ncbi:hypothetical protein AC1031_005214 [Aphanomyces cochlioides]|nr:hypothetical protein AC1031_005214 [Aphanomyces cochlioides]
MSSIWLQRMSAPKAMCKAVSDGNMVELRKLLPDCDVNAASDPDSKYCGKAPLHIVCESGRLNVLNLLLSVPSIDVNARTPYNETPLYFACQHGHVEVVRLLLARPETNVNMTSGNHWSPLHSASENGFVEVVQLLLSRPEIEVNGMAWRRTPLQLAFYQGHQVVARMLLQHPSIVVNLAEHPSPLDLALKRRHDSLLATLGLHCIDFFESGAPSETSKLFWTKFFDPAFPIDTTARSTILESIVADAPDAIRPKIYDHLTHNFASGSPFLDVVPC